VSKKKTSYWMISVGNRVSLFKTGLLLALFFVVSGCIDQAETYHINGETMGTTYHISVVSDSYVDVNKLKRLVDGRLSEVNQAMSTYIVESELSLLNKVPAPSTNAVSEELIFLINAARDIGERSDGYYDITIGPLVNLWGFGPGSGKPRIPSDDEIVSARQKVGWDKFYIEDGLLTKRAHIYLDLSSIAKGYGVDQILEVLKLQGYQNVLVEIGGEVRGVGVNQRGLAWRVGVESPDMMNSSPVTAVSLDNFAVATSGDYRNFFVAEQKRYGHTIDPHSGYPISHDTLSVTVLAEDCMTADGWSTALNSAGVDAGLEIANREGIAAYFIYVEADDFAVKYSDAFKALQEK